MGIFARRMHKFKSDKLTAREQMVLELLAAGLSDKQIAEALCLSWATARTHVDRIREKLYVHSRPALVAYVLLYELVDRDKVQALWEAYQPRLIEREQEYG